MICPFCGDINCTRKHESTSLELVDTDELLEELFNRFDACTFSGLVSQTKEIYTWRHKVKSDEDSLRLMLNSAWRFFHTGEP